MTKFPISFFSLIMQKIRTCRKWDQDEFQRRHIENLKREIVFAREIIVNREKDIFFAFDVPVRGFPCTSKFESRVN